MALSPFLLRRGTIYQDSQQNQKQVSEPEERNGAPQRHAPIPWSEWLDAVDVELVYGSTGWEEALGAVAAAGVVGVDTETTGLDPLQNRLRLVQLAVPVYAHGERHLLAADGKGAAPNTGARVYVVDLFVVPEKERQQLLEDMAALVADPSITKVFHNAKFDLAFLRAALGKRLVVERIFDTMLASQLVTAGDFVPGGRWESWCEERGLRPAQNSHGRELRTRLLDGHDHLLEFEHDNQKEIKPFYPTHSLQQVAHRHLEVWLEKDCQLADWRGAVTDELLRYAARDAAVLLPLYEVLKSLLVRNCLVDVAAIEFACVPAAVEVELTGMPFDAPKAREVLAVVEGEAERHRTALVSLAGTAGFKPRPRKGRRNGSDLNPDSAADCVDALRALARVEEVLTGNGEKFAFLDDTGMETLDVDTRDETLARLATRLPEGSNLRRFAEHLRAYRVAKKRADFLRDWLAKLHLADDRLHPDLRQVNPQGVGRFSASNPSLQQVPRGSEIRSLFRAPQGRKLVVADYSGIEMRIMAQLSGDRNLLAAFREGADVHTRTAASIAGKPEDRVTREERQAAKACGFGLIYGMTAETLRLYAETSYNVGMTPEEAEKARQAFFRAYPGVAAWHKRQEKLAFESGFQEYWRHDAERGFYTEKRPCVRTLGGRLRVWPTVKQERRDGNGTYLRKAGPFTELYNTPDQGTGADMIKCAMVRLYRELLKRGWEEVKLIATVHDELVLEAPETLAEQVAELLGAAMECAAARFLPDVPVEVEAVVCDTWGDKS